MIIEIEYTGSDTVSNKAIPLDQIDQDTTLVLDVSNDDWRDYQHFQITYDELLQFRDYMNCEDDDQKAVIWNALSDVWHKRGVGDGIIWGDVFVVDSDNNFCYVDLFEAVAA